MNLNIIDTFTLDLPADPILENYTREVKNACFSYVSPKILSNPSLLHYSKDVLQLIGLDEVDAHSQAFLEVFSGSKILENTRPVAMNYGGHQFGQWAGQLGDGRAINLFEVHHLGTSWSVQLKGAGPTPYSRRADGFAVLRSSIREYLCSEAMYHLGVPTTRALSLVLTGDQVERDVMYNGNPGWESGAIVCRVAPSFLRFGNFQILAAHRDITNLKLLTDYTIRQYFAHLGEPKKDVYLGFLDEVIEKTMALMVEWERVGFVHGVMNTDNMSILGLTIDYGPYGWLEDYDPNWTPNTTDAGQKRYRFGNQGNVAWWNLVQLANAIFPLIEDERAMNEIFKNQQKKYTQKRDQMWLSKMGLQGENISNLTIVKRLDELLYRSQMDMTLFFRQLSNFDGNNISGFLDSLSQLSYEANFQQFEMSWQDWLVDFGKIIRVENENPKQRKVQMNATNPKYVLRNYMAQLAIEAADQGDYSVLNEIFELLKKPYYEQANMEKYFALRPDWARHKIGCSMLSCSS